MPTRDKYMQPVPENLSIYITTYARKLKSKTGKKFSFSYKEKYFTI